MREKPPFCKQFLVSIANFTFILYNYFNSKIFIEEVIK